MDSSTLEIIVKLGLFMVPFLFAISFHEFSHGWVAKQKGDNTAEILGRLTLNPVAHLDIVGTLIVPSMALIFGWPLFGWAKPVPVNSRNLKDVKNDMFWIAAAGPLSNILLAMIGGGILHLMLLSPTETLSTNFYTPILEMLIFFIKINVVLAIFNLLPMHPLDGGKILARFLPYRINRFLEDNQATTSIILVCLVLTGGLAFISFPVYWLTRLFIPGGLL